MSFMWSRKAVSRACVLVGLVTMNVLVLVAVTMTGRYRDDIDRTTSYFGKYLSVFKTSKQLEAEASKAAEEKLLTKIKMTIENPPSEGPWYSLAQPQKTYFSQNSQDFIVAKLFRNKRNGTFLEAGALNGELLSNTLYLERNLGWSGLLLEPGSIGFASLKAKRRQRARLLRACLAPNKTAGDYIFDTKDSGMSFLAALAKVDVKHLQYWEKVPCYPLYTVLRAMMASDDVVLDYLSLDIEGDELKVLKTVPWKRVRVHLMSVEITHVPEGSKAVRVYMESQGYLFEGLHGEDYFFYHPDYKHELDLHS